MKTFEEACKAVFVVVGPGEERPPTEVSEAQERYHRTIEHAVRSPEADLLVSMFHELHHRSGMAVDVLIKNAFAQGVAVGLEMSREVPFEEVGIVTEIQ
jgi:acyl-CoA hydrolase